MNMSYVDPMGFISSHILTPHPPKNSCCIVGKNGSTLHPIRGPADWRWNSYVDDSCLKKSKGNVAYPCWVVVSNIFHFQPYLGKWSNLTNIFQMGWNHQLAWEGTLAPVPQLPHISPIQLPRVLSQEYPTFSLWKMANGCFCWKAG